MKNIRGVFIKWKEGKVYQEGIMDISISIQNAYSNDFIGSCIFILILLISVGVFIFIKKWKNIQIEKEIINSYYKIFNNTLWK